MMPASRVASNVVGFLHARSVMLLMQSASSQCPGKPSAMVSMSRMWAPLERRAADQNLDSRRQTRPIPAILRSMRRHHGSPFPSRTVDGGGCVVYVCGPEPRAKSPCSLGRDTCIKESH